MRNSSPAPESKPTRESWVDRLANYTASHGWLIAKVVFAAHYILWLVLSYFPIPFVINYDTNVYRTAAYHLAQRQPIYWLNIYWRTTQDPYYYSPQFAWIFSLFNFIDGRTFAYLFGIGFLVIPLVLSLQGWQSLVSDLDLDKDTFYRWLPLVLLATSTIANFIYGNVVILLTGLLGVGLCCIFRKRSLPLAVIIVAMILTKPQFAAPLVVVLLFGLPEKASREFVFRTAFYAISMYAVVTGVFLLAVGVNYGLQSMGDYVQFMLQATAHFPYVTANTFFTINHSIDQQFYRLGLGNYAWISPIIKLLFGLYFLWLLYRSFKADFRLATHGKFLVVLALMAYLVISSFTWELMELLVGPIILAFLLSLSEETTQLKRGKWLLALLFVWELIVPVISVIPTSLVAVLILFWTGSRYINFSLKHQVEPSFVPGQS